MEVQDFLWANGSSSRAGRILFVVGGALLPEHWGAMRRAYARGRAARPMEEPRLPHRLFEPLAEVRRRLEEEAAAWGRAGGLGSRRRTRSRRILSNAARARSNGARR
jgi:hypothetical protein